MNFIKIIISIFVLVLLASGVLYGIKISTTTSYQELELITNQEIESIYDESEDESVTEDDSQDYIYVNTEEEKFIKTNLTQSSWVWNQTIVGERTHPDSIKVFPRKPDAFTLTFRADGTVSGTTDCNSFGGTYLIQDNRIKFGNFMSTLMYCEDSQEAEFVSMITNGVIKLENTSFTLITPNSEIFFNLKNI